MSKKKDKKENPKKKKNEKKNKKPQNVKSSEKEVVFKDVRLFRIMPIIFMAGIALIATGAGMAKYANYKYQIKQSQLSMNKNTELPILTGSSDRGTLTLGNSILSKDGKHLAIEFKYDDTAHQNLSAFGKNYKLWLVTDEKYDSSGFEMKYGFFGTDGVGVMQVTSSKGFPNKAFIVMLMDKTDLSSDTDLTGENVSDETLDKSITAQLAGADSSSDESSNDANNQESGGRPIYYARINPYSAKRLKMDWNDEKELVNQLFIKDNLKKIAKQKESDSAKLEQAKRKKKEYEKRLKANPNDATASQGVENLQSTVESLQANLETEDKNYAHLNDYKIANDILGKQQTKFKLLQTTTEKFNYLSNGDN